MDNIDDKRVGEVGYEVIELLQKSGLSMLEQLIVVSGLFDAMKKAAVFAAVFGDEADEIIEMMIKNQAEKAVDEAESVLREEK